MRRDCVLWAVTLLGLCVLWAVTLLGLCAAPSWVLGAQPPAPQPPAAQPAVAVPNDPENPATVFQKLDRNRDGRLESDEVSPAHERLFRLLLDAADADHDGSLSREEFASSLKDQQHERPLEQLPPQPTLEEVIRRTFYRLDHNGNGKVERDEVPKERRPLFDELLKTADKDGDGALNLAEFTSIYAKFTDEAAIAAAATPKFDADSLLKLALRLDANGDGKISKDEASGFAPLRKNFKKLDLNGDGFLDHDELAKAVKRMAKISQQDSPDALLLRERLGRLVRQLDDMKEAETKKRRKPSPSKGSAAAESGSTTAAATPAAASASHAKK